MKRRWSWRSTGVPGLYTLWCDNRAEVGTVSVLPGYVKHEGVMMDDLVDSLERQPVHARWSSEGGQ